LNHCIWLFILFLYFIPFILCSNCHIKFNGFWLQLFISYFSSLSILYINSVVFLSICRGLETHITFNKNCPPELEGPKTIQNLEFLLLTFIFTSVPVQQLPSSMGEVFLRFEGWVRRFGCAFFWAKGLGESWFLFFSWRGEGVGVGF